MFEILLRFKSVEGNKFKLVINARAFICEQLLVGPFVNSFVYGFICTTV